MKRRCKCITLILSLLLLFSGLCFFTVYKSDFLYIGYEYFARLTRNYQLQEADVASFPMKTVSFSALAEAEGVTVDDSLMLINEHYRIPDSHALELVDFGNRQVNICMLESLLLLEEHVLGLYGEELLIVSAYRDADHQQDVISTSKENVAAAIGASEHQCGLGLDVGVEGYGGRSFLKTYTGRHVNNHCFKYGFIIRYPLCSQNITGITYEPWHIRYVGVPHAEIIYKSGMVLEEYLEALEIGTYYQYEGYLISRQDPNAIIIPEAFESCHLSYDNTGFCVVTVKMN